MPTLDEEERKSIASNAAKRGVAVEFTETHVVFKKGGKETRMPNEAFRKKKA